LHKKITQRIETTAKCIIGIVLLFVLISFVGFEEILESLESAQLIFFLPVLFFFLLVLLVNTLNLQVLFLPFHRFEFLYLFKAQMKSWTAGYLFPGKIGDFSLGLILKKNVSIGTGTAVVVVDKLVSIAVMAAITIIGAIGFFGLDNAAFIFAFTLIGSIAFYFIFFYKGTRLFINKIFLKKHSGKLSGFSSTLDSFFGENKKNTTANVLLTIIRLTFQTTMIYSIFLVFGVTPNFFTIAFILCATTILSLIPLSIGGLGIREGSFVYLCTLACFPIVIATNVALISTALRYLVVFIVGSFTLKEFSFSSLKEQH